MNKTRAASVLVAVSATVMWMGTSAFAAGGYSANGFDPSGHAIRTGPSVNAALMTAGAAPSRCFKDRDRDDKTGHPSDHDGDEAHSCHHKNSSASANKNDGDGDSDDVTPSRCFKDRDRDDRTGHPTDHDGDEAHSCHHKNNSASSSATTNKNDGDGDSDDVTPFRCFKDRDRDDRTGYSTDHDGDEARRCHR